VLNTNRWYHIAVTSVGTNVTLYLNGSSVANGNMPFNTPAGTKLYIGGVSAPYNTRQIIGCVDELSIYNRALSSNEIATIYAARGAGKCPLPPTILSVNPPSWYVNEGATVAYTATAAGSPKLSYQWQHEGSDIIGATNSTLTLRHVAYAQAGTYTVTVSNLAGMVSSNVTLRINRAPLADASATDTLLISPNDTNAIAVLDGSRSSDPDGDPLTYAWFHSGDATPFATTVVAMNTLPVGTNQLTLVVNDGMASGSQNFAIEVITTAQAVDRLIALVKSGSGNTQPLVASLEAALASIDRSNPQTAINQLQAFINKVQVQLAPDDPALAAQLIADAQAIIDALNGGSPVLATTVQISAITHGNSGKSHLKVKGISGRVYVVETSTNMVDWVPVGVATKNADGDYDFDDSRSQETGMRFYRVVSPK
jgi:PKD repeat protein